jgi:hypothetical protein
MNKDNDYIPVDSILEIQNNLKMDLLDKRYIDKNGNRFVVRFGKESRKLEILRIVSKSDIVSDSTPTNQIFSKQFGEEEDSMNISEIDSETNKDTRNQLREAEISSERYERFFWRY